MTTTRYGRVSKPPHKFSPERVKFIDDFTDDEYDDDAESLISSTVSYSEDEGPNEYKKDGFVVSDDDTESVGSTDDSWHPDDGDDDDEDDYDTDEGDDYDTDEGDDYDTDDDMEEDFEEEDFVDEDYEDEDEEEDLATMLDEEEGDIEYESADSDEEEGFRSWKERAANIKQRVTGATHKVLNKARTYRSTVTGRIKRAGSSLRGLDERFLDIDFDNLDLEEDPEDMNHAWSSKEDPEEVMDLIFNNQSNLEEPVHDSRKKYTDSFDFQPYESDDEDEEED